MIVIKVTAKEPLATEKVAEPAQADADVAATSTPAEA